MTSLPFKDLGPVRQSPDAVFNEWWPVFWEAWPHKVDKQEAMKEFRKALKITEPTNIIEGENHYIQHKEDWRAWMGPAKFLRRRRWEDVYTHAPSGKPTGTRTLEALAIIAEHVRRDWYVPGHYDRDVLEQCVAAELLTVDEMEANL